MTVGVVLEGGGMRGHYTQGVLDAWLDENLHVDGMVTVSAGALFGINFPSKQRARSLRYNKNYIQDKNYISLKNLIKTGNIIDTDFAYREIPQNLDPFDEERFEKSAIDFYATVTNVETGQAEHHLIKNAYRQIDTLRASGSMPFVSKMVPINGATYLDGGISDPIPIQKVQRLGYDKIIVVLTRPKGYRKKPGNKWIVKAKYKNYPKLQEALLNRHLRYNQTLEYIDRLSKNREIFVIQPSSLIEVKRLERDPSRLQALYDLGYQDMLTQMDQLKYFLN